MWTNLIYNWNIEMVLLTIKEKVEEGGGWDQNETTRLKAQSTFKEV